MTTRARLVSLAVAAALAIACRNSTPARARGLTAPALAPTPAPALAPTPTPTPTPTPAPVLAPFGPPVPVPRYTCPAVLRGGHRRAFLAAADTQVAFVDGDDPLALADRAPTGVLPPTYAPSDLVDVRTGKPRTASACEASHACLRRDAAAALRDMLDQMRKDGVAGHVTSAYRGFATQCWVFESWASRARGGFCEATEQSALPGHSQHQLGTTLDLFTEQWAQDGAKSGGGVFRDGFGCSPGGRWIDEESWRFGFVLSYPMHPDDRKGGSPCEPRRDRPESINPKTGYMHEPWHLRFIGAEAAARFHAAWLASGPGTPGEISLEQWLRRGRGLAGDAELPVCDGCECGACSTLAADDRGTPCGAASLRLDADGRPLAPAEDPVLLGASARAAGDAVVVEARVHSPAHTVTQTPVTNADLPTYAPGSTYESLAPYPDAPPRAYGDLAGAWRVAIEPIPRGAAAWPWRASLAAPELAASWNRANLLLPAKPGDASVRVRVPATLGVARLRVTLLHVGPDGQGGVEHGTVEIPVP